MGGPRFTLLGTGAARSPRYPPAGLLVEHNRRRVAIEGGPRAEPEGRLDAWTDLLIEPREVVHTSHPALRVAAHVAGHEDGLITLAIQARHVLGPRIKMRRP